MVVRNGIPSHSGARPSPIRKLRRSLRETGQSAGTPHKPKVLAHLIPPAPSPYSTSQ